MTARSRRAAIVAGLVGALAAPAPAQAAPGFADLKVTAITSTGLGSPEYVLVRPDGGVSSFLVHITVRNVGNHFSHPSETELTAVFKNAREQIALVHFHGLNPGHSQTVTTEVQHQFNHIGFASLRAEANTNRAVREVNRRNNSLTRLHIAFLAQVWKVGLFTDSIVHQGLPTKESRNTSSLVFVFSEYSRGNEAFIYDVQGGVEGSVHGEYFEHCSVTGSGVATHSLWAQPTSYLRVKQKLDSYSAFVYASPEQPFEASDVCGGIKVAAPKEQFVDLSTIWSGGYYAPMAPEETTLENKGTNQGEIASWEFNAQVPGVGPPPPPPT